MTVAIKSLSLIIPGLLDETNPQAIGDQIRQHASLRCLLDRADAVHANLSGFERTMMQVATGECDSMSYAWLSRQGEQDEQAHMPVQRAWLRVDPVYMQADRDNVVLFGA
ncbi:MAG TPA: hypothetical protein ENI64_05195, partial [Gammaproteobacteria bacterium]|nr:hypothetical protein [Gammaproteobacteria bacterium]